jgi:hypothetical protein
MPCPRSRIERSLEQTKKEVSLREAYLDKSEIKKEDQRKDSVLKSLHATRRALLSRLRAVKQIEDTNAAVTSRAAESA